MPDPTERRFSIERDVLKLALQHPTTLDDSWADLDATDFTHPYYREMYEQIAQSAVRRRAGPTRCRCLTDPALTGWCRRCPSSRCIVTDAGRQRWPRHTSCGCASSPPLAASTRSSRSLQRMNPVSRGGGLQPHVRRAGGAREPPSVSARDSDRRAAVTARSEGRQRRLALPASVVARLQLDPGERPLAWALGEGQRWYVGTDRAVHLDEGDGEQFRKVAYEDVERAEWQGEESRLAVVEVASWGEPERRTQINVEQPGRLLELLRERVTRSVVINLYAPVHGRRGLSVIGRRSPAAGGQITWSYLLAKGLDPDDPAVQEVAARTLSAAEAELAGL